MDIIHTNRIGCIGAGYVGGPTMAMIANKCPHLSVHVCDKNPKVIDQWNSENFNLPIYEPGLVDILKRTRNNNLYFTLDIEWVICKCDILFVSVNTPTKNYGIGKGEIADLTSWESCARSISRYSKNSKIIIEKSTVPVHTADALQEVLNSQKSDDKIEFIVLSNPEFLAEGTAIHDLEFPDRILIGGPIETEIGRYCMNTLSKIYEYWIPKERILFMNVWSSELSKLTANAFLAQRLSSINSISRLCNVTGADISEISKAIGMDSRIGSKFLNASLGFGGSCFKKDVLCLSYILESYGLSKDAKYWRSVIQLNEYQKDLFVEIILKSMFHTVKNKKILILGFAFKSNTGDTRETPATTICEKLHTEGAEVFIFDPCVKFRSIREEFIETGNHNLVDYLLEDGKYNNDESYIYERYATVLLESVNLNNSGNLLKYNKEKVRSEDFPMSNNEKNTHERISIKEIKDLTELARYNSKNRTKLPYINVVSSLEEGIIDSHAIVVCTDWDMFANIDYELYYQKMNKPAFIFDGRNILNHQQLFKIGFNVFRIGKKPLLHQHIQDENEVLQSFKLIINDSNSNNKTTINKENLPFNLLN
ncbi:UDP-glucose dehydrogenase, putative [Cryptosporidium muris RN66]|uniref:UDP-glucose 6-dehydrogenase n=1 Tax=Cryptosporidium muris (strain RN66) TaxID=441375 RepID=B6AAS5_CRYMR|nr:UDP-glucose dehydrogenase, putative [Cryptosporidium muris RN66]EEA05477.1 UDP-glucose dehydrogenase, putative [Cryptosporidium muris RN66]|eukprot:XP_002139826.1 UDP-glucose dehydrogenase [Cryptosporidium muris RN66]